MLVGGLEADLYCVGPAEECNVRVTEVVNERRQSSA